MSLEVSGRLHAKFPTQQIKDNFQKREFVLELTEETPTGMVFTNYASFQLVNASCSVIDQFNEGDVLKVNFNIRGNRWERDGQVKYITNLNAWRVERAATGAPAQQQQQQQAAPQYNQPQYNQPQGGNFSAGNQQGADDLPF